MSFVLRSKNANRYMSCFQSRALLILLLVIDVIRASAPCSLRLACAKLYFPRARFVRLSVCQSVSLSVCLSCLSVCLSCLSVCLSVQLSDGRRVRFPLLPRLCVCVFFFIPLFSALDIKYGEKGFLCWSAFSVLVTALTGGFFHAAGMPRTRCVNVF